MSTTTLDHMKHWDQMILVGDSIMIGTPEHDGSMYRVTDVDGPTLTVDGPLEPPGL